MPTKRVTQEKRCVFFLKIDRTCSNLIITDKKLTTNNNTLPTALDIFYETERYQKEKRKDI